MIFGTFNIFNRDLIKQCIDLGISKFDTASLYENEYIFKSFKDCYIQTKIKKEDIFNITNAFEQSRINLDRDVIDCVLLHYPYNNGDKDKELHLMNAWEQLCKLKQSGLITKIGVSNFNIKYLNLIEEIGFADVCQSNYLFLKHNKMSKINQIYNFKIKNKKINLISLKHNVSNYKILLDYFALRNIEPLFTSSNIEHIKEDINNISYSEIDKKFLRSIRL